MSLTVVPLMIVALFMASTGGDVERAELLLSGEHEIFEQWGPIIVGDATVVVPDGSQLPGPIYVTGGELVVRGSVTGDVIQLAGAVRVEEGSAIGGELQLLGGTQRVAPGAEVRQRTVLPVPAAGRGPVANTVPTAVLVIALCALAAALARRRPTQLDHVADAATAHPVVTLTVGVLSTVTFLSLFVFMAFTLILIPVAVVGGLVGLALVAYGVIALGRLVGRRFRLRSDGWAAALGTLLTIAAMVVISYLPVVGDLLVVGVLLAGVGAVLVTYLGVTAFRPAELTDVSTRPDSEAGA